MTASLLALSLSSTFTQIGAIAAFAALIAIAILSLLAFSQARELKRLREWAGRAPERAAELEQRVSATAASRVQQPNMGEVRASRGVAPATPATGATPVPRAAPPGASGQATPAPSPPSRRPRQAPVRGRAILQAGPMRRCLEPLLTRLALTRPRSLPSRRASARPRSPPRHRALLRPRARPGQPPQARAGRHAAS